MTNKKLPNKPKPNILTPAALKTTLNVSAVLLFIYGILSLFIALFINMDSYGLIEPIHGDHTLANIRSFIAVAFGINFMIQAVRLGLDSDTKHNDDKLFAVVLILGGPIVLLWLNDQVATLLPSSHKIVGSITAIAIILVGLVGTLLLWKNIGKPKAPKLKGWNIPK